MFVDVVHWCALLSAYANRHRIRSYQIHLDTSSCAPKFRSPEERHLRPASSQSFQEVKNTDDPPCLSVASGERGCGNWQPATPVPPPWVRGVVSGAAAGGRAGGQCDESQLADSKVAAEGVPRSLSHLLPLPRSAGLGVRSRLVRRAMPFGTEGERRPPRASECGS